MKTLLALAISVVALLGAGAAMSMTHSGLSFSVPGHASPSNAHHR